MRGFSLVVLVCVCAVVSACYLKTDIEDLWSNRLAVRADARCGCSGAQAFILESGSPRHFLMHYRDVEWTIGLTDTIRTPRTVAIPPGSQTLLACTLGDTMQPSLTCNRGHSVVPHASRAVRSAFSTATFGVPFGPTSDTLTAEVCAAECSDPESPFCLHFGEGERRLSAALRALLADPADGRDTSLTMRDAALLAGLEPVNDACERGAITLSSGAITNDGPTACAIPLSTETEAKSNLSLVFPPRFEARQYRSAGKLQSIYMASDLLAPVMLFEGAENEAANALFGGRILEVAARNESLIAVTTSGCMAWPLR